MRWCCACGFRLNFMHSPRDPENRIDARESDTETGLYYYRARYYDPSTGRFLSEDPLTFESDDLNFYGYVANSPMTDSDPFGLCRILFNGSLITIETNNGSQKLGPLHK
jgi:RHS repeat-associated protein